MCESLVVLLKVERNCRLRSLFLVLCRSCSGIKNTFFSLKLVRTVNAEQLLTWRRACELASLKFGTLNREDAEYVIHTLDVAKVLHRLDLTGVHDTLFLAAQRVLRCQIMLEYLGFVVG